MLATELAQATNERSVTVEDMLLWLDEAIQETGWTVEDDSVLLTCCDDMVEYDCPRCPSCGKKNPVMRLGII